MARHVPVPVPCHARPSLMNAGARRPARVNILHPLQMSRTYNLGKLISQYSTLVRKLGWEEFVKQCRGRVKFYIQGAVKNLDRLLLHQYKHRDDPIVLTEESWTEGDRQVALAQGPHRSALEHTLFLCNEFDSMAGKGQWVVLPYSVAQNLLGLRLSPLGIKEEKDHRPRWLGDYSYYKLNCSILPLAKLSSIQYGRALDRLLQEIVFADPARGHVYMLKADVSDGFYRISLHPDEYSKLGLVFPLDDGDETLVSTPLNLPMGWNNLSPLFCTATETVTDLENQALRAYSPLWTYNMDDRQIQLLALQTLC